MEWQVIPWTQEMLEESVDFLIDVFSREPWNETYDSRKQVEDYFRNMADNNYFVGFAGLLDGRLAALCLGMKKAWIQGMEYYIDSFSVRYDLQGQGIGSRFLQEIESRLPDLGLKGVMLTTDRTAPAFRFYEKNGMTSLEELRIFAKG